jgi:hypothetical protein
LALFPELVFGFDHSRFSDGSYFTVSESANKFCYALVMLLPVFRRDEQRAVTAPVAEFLAVEALAGIRDGHFNFSIGFYVGPRGRTSSSGCC